MISGCSYVDDNPQPVALRPCRLYSEFTNEIARFETAVREANNALILIQRCRESRREIIAEERAYIKRVQALVGQTRREIVQEQKKEHPSARRIARLNEQIEEMQSNIERSNEKIAECLEAISQTGPLKAAWQAEVKKRMKTLLWLRRTHKKGLDSQGKPRLCGSITTSTKYPCKNEREYVDEAWRYCLDHYKP